MRSMPVIWTYVGATARALTFTLKDSDGMPRDYSSGDIECYLTATLGGVVKIDEGQLTKVVVGENDAGEDGVFSYTPSAAEIDTAGDYRAIIRIVDSSGEDDTYDFTEKLLIKVEDTDWPEAE